MNTIRLAQLAFGLRHGVLGASDHRMGVWTQGCSLPKCRGCTSTHTWSPVSKYVFAVDTLLRFARAQAAAPEGLTLSGGEPTDQASAVADLIRGFREAFPGAEVVMYSGLRWPVLAKRHPQLLPLLDVAVTGPYVRTLEATALTGSSNQEVKLLTPLAERLYAQWQTWPPHVLQVDQAPGNRIVMVGIPDTERLATATTQAHMVDGTWDQGGNKS